MNDNIKLPQLPEWMCDFQIPADEQDDSDFNWLDWRMKEYAREAVLLNVKGVPDERKAFDQWWASVPIHRPLAHLDAWAAWQARAAISSSPAAPQPEISTKHGPWVESTLYEGETYCQRCLTRSVFAGNRECDPHIVSAPATPKPAQQPLTDEHKAILRECRNQAMRWILQARIPEAGAFGGIAQDLDYLCGQLGVKND